MKTFDNSIAVLRFFCILAVILIHTTTRTLEAASFDLIHFQTTLFLNQISRFAVPLFIGISGFVLELNFDNHTNYFSYFKKRISRIIFPYLFWSLIYYYLVYSNNSNNFIKVLLTGNASYQLYFIPTLCIYYLIFPFLHKTYKYISNKWVLTLLFFSQIILLYQDYFVAKIKLEDPIRIILFSFFVFILGMIASHNKNKIIQIISHYKKVVIPLTLILSFYVFYEGRGRYLQTNNYLSFYSQWRPSVLIYSIFIGTLFLYIFNNFKFKLLILEIVSKLSYLVFFIHIIVLECVWKFIGKDILKIISNNIFEMLLFELLFFSLVSTISFLFAYIIHKVPKLEKITG